MVAAAPLTVNTLHIDVDVMPDTSLVRVTTYISGGATLMASRVLTITCMSTVMETFALSVSGGTCAFGSLMERTGAHYRQRKNVSGI